MPTLAHQLEIKFADEKRKRVSVIPLEGLAGSRAIRDAIARGSGAVLVRFRQNRFKEALAPDLLCLDWRVRAHKDDTDCGYAGMKHTNHPAASRGSVGFMGSQESKGIGVAAGHE